MRFDGLGSYAQVAGNLLVRLALRHQLHNLALLDRERQQRLTAVLALCRSINAQQIGGPLLQRRRAQTRQQRAGILGWQVGQQAGSAAALQQIQH